MSQQNWKIREKNVAIIVLEWQSIVNCEKGVQRYEKEPGEKEKIYYQEIIPTDENEI